jgi:glucosamine kinase
MFHHYAGAARHLSFSLMQRLACAMAGPEDAEFVAQVLEFWGVASVGGLGELMLRQRSEDYQSIKRSYGALARLATSAAERGAPLAVGVCEDAVRALALGVRLLGGCFRGPEVGVALIGGLARSPYISTRVGALLSEPGPRRYTLVDPGLPPAAGAALLALRQIGAPVDETLVARLAESLAGQAPPAG